MGVSGAVKRQATILGFTAVVIAFLFAVTAIVPFSLLPFYLAGWFLTLASTGAKGTRIGRGRSEALLFVLDGAALFLFVAVAFRSLDFGALPAALAGLAGVAAVVYGMSI